MEKIVSLLETCEAMQQMLAAARCEAAPLRIAGEEIICGRLVISCRGGLVMPVQRMVRGRVKTLGVFKPRGQGLVWCKAPSSEAGK